MTRKTQRVPGEVRLMDILEEPFEGLSLIHALNASKRIVVPYAFRPQNPRYFYLEPKANDILMSSGSGKAYLMTEDGIARSVNVVNYCLGGPKLLYLDHILQHFPEGFQPRDLKSFKELVGDGIQLENVTLSFSEGLRYQAQDFYLADVQYLDNRNRIPLTSGELPNIVSLRQKALAGHPSFRLSRASPAE